MSKSGTGYGDVEVVFRMDEITGEQIPVYKFMLGNEGVNGGYVSASNPLPVSAAALPLPAGASTEATLVAVKNALDSLVGNTDAVETLQTATNNALTALQGYNDSVESLLTSLGTNTDGLEALLNTLGVQTDQVEPLLTDIKAATEAANAKLPALVGGRIPVELPAGGGGLTDAELRAEPVPVLDDHAGSLLHLILKTLLSPFGYDKSLARYRQTAIIESGTVTTVTTASNLVNIDSRNGATLINANSRAAWAMSHRSRIT